MSQWTAVLLTFSAPLLIGSSADAPAQSNTLNSAPDRSEPSQPARPRVNPAQWIGTDVPFNPHAPEEGIVTYKLIVGRDGRPTECLIQQSSGSATLDRGTCAMLVRRARFWPATDAKGKPTEGEWSGKVQWVIPDDPEPAKPA